MTERLPVVNVGDPTVLIPGAASEAVPGIGASNNNLDACQFSGRRYLAWRTAPSHFASADAAIHVVSASGEAETWRHEVTISMRRDVREPRLFLFGGTLFLYYFTLGADWQRFEPDQIWVCALSASGWSDPAPVSATRDCVVWRVRMLGSLPIMTVYRHAGKLYTRQPVPTEVEFWTTADGFSWYPLNRDAVVHVGGTETELIEHPARGWIAVTRKEGPTSFGSDIAQLDELNGSCWRTNSVPQKLDSPLLFRWREFVILIARRTTEFQGAYDLKLPGIDDVTRTAIYHRVYWATPKRSTVWMIDPDSLMLTRLADLPGRGDTCFPAIVPESEDTFTIYNYTSPLSGPDLPWVAGQWGETYIYRSSVRFGLL
jgi:hypothetical protein